MKYLQYFESKLTNFEKDNINVSGIIFNKITISTSNFKGKRRKIDYDVSQNKIIRSNLNDGFGELVIDFLKKYNRELEELYGYSNINNLTKEVTIKTFNLNNKGKTYDLGEWGEPIAYGFLGGIYEFMVASKIIVYDNMAKIISNGGDELIIQNNSIFSRNNPCFLIGYYTKGLSKFTKYVRDSKNLYDIIKKYAPKHVPTLINIDFIESFGWERKNYQEYYNNWNLRESNMVMFTKNEKILIFDFWYNNAHFFNNNEKKLIEKITAVEKEEIDKFINLIKNQ